MASDSDCNLEIVRQFIVSNGGKVRNPDLVSRFKRFLNDPENKVVNRTKFKDYVNTLATIKVDEGGEKVLRLKKKFTDLGDVSTDITSESSSISSSSKSYTDPSQDDLPSYREVSPGVEQNNNENDRRSENHGVKQATSGDSSIMVDDVMANMSVMERAKHLNKIQTESDLLKANVKRREVKTTKHRDGDDDDSGSIGYVTLTDAERQWLYTCCTADYHPMVQLLSHNASLARVRDFTNGYTALHWAAKHGKPEVVKMIAGRHEVNVNQRSHGGYTPLHLAAMHGHDDIIELLVHTYKADPNLRDNSGKRAKQYLKNSASSRINQLLLCRKSTSSYQGYDESFHRSTNIRQSSRARAISSLLFSTSSIMKQPYFQTNYDVADDDSRKYLSTPSSTPSSSPMVNRRGSAHSETSFVMQRHSLDCDKLTMPPPSSVPRRVLNLHSSSTDNIPSDVVMNRTSSDPNFDRISSSVFI